MIRYHSCTCRGPLAVVLCFLLCLTGCSGRGGLVRDAAVEALRDPWTWGPLAGAALITATDNDHRLSDWAKTETPVFGSNQGALDASDQWRAAASATAWATFLLANPRGDGDWGSEKAIDVGANLAGLAMARNFTGVLKHAVGRERPNGRNEHDSFPSAHASDAAAHATLARAYADYLPVWSPLAGALKLGASGMAAATAWARVEGGVHYPTDVLMGAAVANFSTRLFLNLAAPDPKRGWRITPQTGPGGETMLNFEKRF